MIGIQDNTYEAAVAKYAELNGRIDALRAYLENETYPNMRVVKAMLGIEEGDSDAVG